MIRRFTPLVLFLQFATDILFTLFSIRLAQELRLHLVTHFEQREQFVVVQTRVYVLILAIWILFFFVFGVYDARRKIALASDLGNLWFSLTISMLVLTSLFYLLGWNVTYLPSRLFDGYFYAIDLVLLTFAHVAAFQVLASIRRRGRQVRRVLLVGGGVRGRHVAVRIAGREAAGLVLAGYLADDAEQPLPNVERLGSLDQFGEVVTNHAIGEVVVALPAQLHGEVLRMVEQLQDWEIPVRVLPDVFEMVAMKAHVEDFFGLPLISVREPSINPVQAHVKRAFDIVVSSLVLLFALPAAVVTAVWIKLDSKGPVFLHQRRIGAGGAPFYMHKFRSMNWEPDEVPGSREKEKNDQRVTRAGRFLRRTSLDEIPQLWNVLAGEMSLVGPRPELPAIVERYEPWQRKRLSVPPGMTGWWQVSGRAEKSMHLNTEIDLFYIQNYSILLDIQILFRTFGAVIKGKGAF